MPDTLFPVCSTGKGITATLFHRVVAQGKIDTDRHVADYWPEFGVHGKETVTVRQAISHQAGIPQRAVFASFDEICDWHLACARIAALQPAWTPGSTAEYHSLNWGWIVGGVLERATGRSFGDILREELTAPLGLEREIFFGVDDESAARVARFVPQPSAQEQVMTAQAEATEVPGPLLDFVNRPDVMRACMPAVNGLMSARGIAKVYAAAMGPVEGVRLLDDDTLDSATALQTPRGALPACFGHGMGLGYPLKGPSDAPGAFFGHGGAGGSEGMGIRPLRLAYGFTKNRYDTHADAPNHLLWAMVDAIFDSFGRDADGGFYRCIHGSG